MSLNDMFGDEYIASRDTDTHRVCGTCGALRPLTDFYKDGKDSEGNSRYRRDCKDCYKATRISENKMKEHKGGTHKCRETPAQNVVKYSHAMIR